MDFIDWRRDGGHLCQRWHPGILQHRTAQRVDAHLLRRGDQSLMIETVLDWRDGWHLAVAFVATAREEAIEFVKNITTL